MTQDKTSKTGTVKPAKAPKKTASPKAAAAKKAAAKATGSKVARATPSRSAAKTTSSTQKTQTSKAQAPKVPASKAQASKTQTSKTQGNTITVTQIASPIRRPARQRAVLIGLGLNKINRTRTLEDTPAVRGMVRKVQHMVRVLEPKE